MFLLLPLPCRGVPSERNRDLTLATVISDSMDSMDSTDSLDSLDSMDSKKKSLGWDTAGYRGIPRDTAYY